MFGGSFGGEQQDSGITVGPQTADRRPQDRRTAPLARLSPPLGLQAVLQRSIPVHHVK